MEMEFVQGFVVIAACGHKEIPPKQWNILPPRTQLAAVPRGNSPELLKAEPCDHSADGWRHPEQQAGRPSIEACHVPRERERFPHELSCRLDRETDARRCDVPVSRMRIPRPLPPVFVLEVNVCQEDGKSRCAFASRCIETSPQFAMRADDLGRRARSLGAREPREHLQEARIDLMDQFKRRGSNPLARRQCMYGVGCSIPPRSQRHTHLFEVKIAIVGCVVRYCCSSIARISGETRAGKLHSHGVSARKDQKCGVSRTPGASRVQ